MAQEEGRSSLVLARDALKAAGEWARDDFVDSATYARRLAACEECPFYTVPPPRAVYNIARRVSPDARICARCGCFTKLKARLVKQRCPAASSEKPSTSRWGEPMVR